jgi:exosortase
LTLQGNSKLVGTRDLLIALGFLVAAIAAMWDAWREIIRIGFASEEHGYLLLAPVMIVWLTWARRSRLRECRVRHLWLGVLAIAAGWAVYWYGYVNDPVLWRAGAVMVAGAAVIAGLGWDVVWKFLPAFVATIFLIPVSPNGRYRLAIPLQNATAQATQTVCDVLGIYVDRAGNMLTINGVDVTVAEACNGMRMILTLFMVCYVVAFTLSLRPWLRVLLLLSTPIVAVIANVIRLVPTVWLFGHASREAAERFHDVSGWVMTVASFVLLLGVFNSIEKLLGGAPDANDSGDNGKPEGGSADAHPKAKTMPAAGGSLAVHS